VPTGNPVAYVRANAMPPLVAAARDDQVSQALTLIDKGANVNATAPDGTTALIWAVHHDEVSLIERLLKAHANVGTANEFGATAMSEAATFGDTAVIEKLVRAGADVDSPNADGQTALMILARTDNVKAAEFLIRHGASVNAREQWLGQTALMWAAARGQPQMVKLLLEHHADPNARAYANLFRRQVTAEPRVQARPAGGFTPLLYAARQGCIDCAKYLVEGGADVNLTDPEGVSPLLLATLNFHFDISAFLVQHGADVNKWDLWGRSPIYEAVDMNTLPVGGRADRPTTSKTTGLQLIDLLLKAGANPNLQLKLFPPYRSLRDDRGADGLLSVGTTPLLRAAKAGDIPAMRLLLAHGANPSLPTASGITPLMAAAGNASVGLDTRGRYKTEAQSIEAVKVLLAAGADINARDNNGQTALYGAATWGWNDLVRALAAEKADLSVKDSRGRTAADVAMGGPSSSGRASAEPHPETAALLRNLMAAATNTPVANNE